LNHPNIAQIYGLEKYESTYCIAMELVDGETLADRVRRGPMAIGEALRVAGDIAEALETAHDKGIVHRDLKPANVMVTPEGQVKVLDFGLAKAFEPVSTVAGDATVAPTITSPTITRMGIILGTAAYMSPEQAKGRAADKRGEVWAFGRAGRARIERSRCRRERTCSPVRRSCDRARSVGGTVTRIRGLSGRSALSHTPSA
jgi:serine/threonine-protein kinase